MSDNNKRLPFSLFNERGELEERKIVQLRFPIDFGDMTITFEEFEKAPREVLDENYKVVVEADFDLRRLVVLDGFGVEHHVGEMISDLAKGMLTVDELRSSKEENK
jgi:hypothetical protein